MREVLPGAITAAVILEATFQLLPEYVDISKHNPVLQTLSGPAILLVWLYVMANVIVLGAEVNWWRGAPAPRTSEHGRESHASRAPRVAPARRSRAVRVLRLPVVAELRDRPRLAARDEDRVEAEAPLPARPSAIAPSRTPLPRTSAPSGEISTSSQT